MISRSKTKELQIIQALRGLAALLIVIRHAIHEMQAIIPSFESAVYPYTIGVDIFFVISGFIMVYTGRARFGEPGAWREFIARRILRVVPLYWFYTFLLVLVALIMPEVLGKTQLGGAGLLKSLFFIPYENPAGDVQPFLALGWTLNYEMYFYLVFAALMFLKPAQMIAALTFYFVGTVIAGLYIPAGWTALKFWAGPMVLEFVAGAWIGWFFIQDFRIPAALKYPVCGLALLIPVLLFFPDLFGGKIGHIHKMAAAIALVALLILPRGAEDQKLPRWMTLMGDMSYTLYLSHPFVLGLVTQLVLLTGLAGLLSPGVIFTICIFSAVAGGYPGYLWVEKPLLSRGKKLLKTHF